MCMGILSACMSRHYVHVVLKKTEDDVASTGLGFQTVVGLDKSWEVNSCSLEEQSVLLTIEKPL